ncbi:NADH-ubiquinone oxidoreductase-F iron-sulfur binding region domain-containing protein [Capillimicrobium parvum]|uniref:NADH-quinone oxidoreductase subunit 1 n=1 Tax=Capillimicrobium parvum TaxID=2884022 RepID=A0A9E6XYI6_9ACTN|nr:NADH-ubiquinone oxidoreductase-F iron-sulfur binding region domain-containing protein [Capillimicrobium parvum]UGS36799.1 NADH-quinone oxidoreductase subunit 1 [Capillimicrobium parvum]
MTPARGLPRLTAGLARRVRLDLDAHLAVHGPLDLDARAPGALIDATAEAGLRGRGGAGYPTARKLAAVARGRRPIVVVNAAESEPLSRKDGVLLEAVPHLVLDGALAAARAVGAREIVLAIPAGAGRAHASLADAVADRPDTRGVTIAGVPRRYLAGEESALVRHLGGGPLRPQVVPPRPAQRGLRGRPTLVQNAETLAHLALVARHGGAWFRALGSAARPGSALVTLTGAIARPGVYEIATGTPLAAVADAAGGTTEPARGVLIGGYFGAWSATAAAWDAPLDATLGSGVLCVLGESACPVAELSRATSWLAGESAGQCGPCVHGLAAIAGALQALQEGTPDQRTTSRIARWTGQVEGRGACHLPDGVARFVRSGLALFAAEIEDHRRHGPCAACSRVPVLETPSAIGMAA